MKTKILTLITGLSMMTATSFGNNAVISRPVAEKEMPMESWMTTPFGELVSEEAMDLKSWMTAPFGELVSEEAMDLESWMTTPFTEIVSEEPICLEPWMTEQFEATACCAGDEWVIAATER